MRLNLNPHAPSASGALWVSCSLLETCWCSSHEGGTFRVGQSDLFPPPQPQVSPLQLLGHQGVELQGGAQARAHLRGRREREVSGCGPGPLGSCDHGSAGAGGGVVLTSFSYWISSMALELPRSCITYSACFSSPSRFIVRCRRAEDRGFEVSPIEMVKKRLDIYWRLGHVCFGGEKAEAVALCDLNTIQSRLLSCILQFALLPNDLLAMFNVSRQLPG